MTKKIISLLLTLAFLLSFPVSFADGAAAKLGTNSQYTFQITNLSGRAITEVYLYPAYSGSWGKTRNLAGWIRNNETGTITVTAAEVARNCTWNLRIGFNYSYYVSYAEWEDIDLNSYLGQTLEVSATYDGWEISLQDDSYSDYNWGTGSNGSSGSGTGYTSLEFKIFNNSGRAITEVYIYPEGSSSWGSIRNNKWIYDGQSTTIRLNSNEAKSNRKWCLRIGFDYSRYVSYAEWSDVDLSDYLGGTMQVGCYFDGYWYINNSTSF